MNPRNFFPLHVFPKRYWQQMSFKRMHKGNFLLKILPMHMENVHRITK